MEVKKKILVVDDDRHFVKILEDWFRSHGFEVLCAYNGKEALDLFRIEAPSAVLLDALIPKMDGFKTCQAMRQSGTGGNTPIIMMSAVYKKATEIKRAKEECGATAYLSKPVSLSEVYNVVNDAIAKATAGS